jgi:diguanylate cyclase (GGDEF)-like protein/PAS domain S-box-containing protein
MDRFSWRMFPPTRMAVTTPPGHDRDTRRGRRAALVATSVLAPGLLMVHGLREGEGDVVAIAVAAALIVVLVVARVGRLMVDVRVLRAAEARIRASETALKEAQHLAQLGSWSWDLTSGEVTWSQELYRILGLPPEEQNASFDMFQRLLHPDDRQRVLELLDRARTATTGFECEHRMVRPDGTVRVLLARGEVHADGAGRPATMVGTAQDVTDRTRAQQAAQRLAAIVQSSSDAIYSVAADGTVTSWNAAAERLLGRPAAEMLGHPITSVWPPEQLEVNRSMLQRAFADEVITDVETVRLHRDGTRVPVTVSWSPIKDDAGAITGVSVIARDITQRKQLEEQLIRQALHDPLTGLANRALFADRLEHALARDRRPGATVAILVIDLDGFKDINDSLGHDAGDDLLMIAGMRLQGHARPGDTVARLGGDEFGVLLEDIAPAEAVRSAAALLEGLATPIVLRDRDLTPTASIGIAIAAGEDAETLLRNADTAMYAAKRQGKGRYALFEPAMHATVVERLDLAADLSRAVEKGQLHLCYEPQISLASGQIRSLEALVRWRHPTRGEVSPGEFIPLAEETGMILPIGRWVLRESCRQVKVWQERWPAPSALTIAVAGLDPRSLVLEITETAIMEQLDAAITILTELRRLGVRLALDDFGTGYSSLSYLQRLPVDILKIDRSFVAGVARSREDSALARGILTLGQTLGLETVAEGIETAEQLAALRELGCQLGQGYFFARPLGPTAVDALLERHYPGMHTPATPAHEPMP